MPSNMTYPKRFKWHNSSLTVDFDTIDSGTVVAGMGRPVGTYKTSWQSHSSNLWVAISIDSKRVIIHKAIGAYRGI